MRAVPEMLAALAVSAMAVGGARAQSPRPVAAPTAPAPPYARVADLVLKAPVIVDSVVRSVATLKGAELAGVAPGMTRVYVEADVLALVRGTESLPARIGYLLDIAPDARGRLPNLKRRRVILFARPVPGHAEQVQLAGRDSQLDWSPALDALTRRIAAEVVAPDAPPAITGVASAFHVPGTLPGEGETQIFLTTANGRPVSLNVIRRPGEEPRWAVALSEIVDEAALPPARDTLLWYRLACFLPSALPPAAVATMTPEDVAGAREDYQFVRTRLGPCPRG